MNPGAFHVGYDFARPSNLYDVPIRLGRQTIDSLNLKILEVMGIQAPGRPLQGVLAGRPRQRGRSNP